MSENVSIFHLTMHDEEGLLQTRRQIAEQLQAGRDVVLILEEPISRRAERLTLATLAMQYVAGRFAVVTTDTERFTQLPKAMAERLHLFRTPEAAVEWMQPASFNMMETLRYVALN